MSIMVTITHGNGCVHDLGTHKGATYGEAPRKLLADASTLMVPVGGAHLAQVMQCSLASSDVLLGGNGRGCLQTKPAVKKLVHESKNANKRSEDSLAVHMLRRSEALKAQDLVDNPWKKLFGSIFCLTDVMWVVTSQANLILGGILAKSDAGWHLDDLAKLMRSVTDPNLLSSVAQSDPHVFVWGGDHPDGHAQIPVAYLITLDTSQFALAQAHLWMQGAYTRITGKKMFVRAFVIDQSKAEIAFICNHINRLTKEDMQKLLLHRAQAGLTPVLPHGLTMFKFCFPHLCALVPTVFDADKTISTDVKEFGKKVARGFLELIEKCVTWQSFQDTRHWGLAISQDEFIALPADGEAHLSVPTLDHFSPVTCVTTRGKIFKVFVATLFSIVGYMLIV